MLRTLLFVCVVLLLAACRDEEVSTPDVLEEVGIAEEREEYQYQEMTPAQMLTHLAEKTATIEQFQSTIHSEKALEAGDVRVGGWIDTAYTMLGATDAKEKERSVRFTQDVHAYETTYKTEGYYLAGEQFMTYDSLTDAWTEQPLTEFTEPQYFYMRPVDLIKALQQVSKEPDYNFIDLTTVELFFELQTEADFDAIYALTFIDIEKNIPYFGGYEWAYTDYPTNIHITADLQKGTIEQYIFRLVEQGMGERQGMLESYFVQNYTYGNVAPIEAPSPNE